MEYAVPLHGCLLAAASNPRDAKAVNGLSVSLSTMAGGEGGASASLTEVTVGQTGADDMQLVVVDAALDQAMAASVTPLWYAVSG